MARRLMGAGGTGVLAADAMAVRPTVVARVRSLVRSPPSRRRRRWSPRCWSPLATCHRLRQFFVRLGQRGDGDRECQIGRRELREDGRVVRRRERKVVECPLQLSDRRNRRRKHAVRTTERFAPPRSQDLSLALEVRETKRRLPSPPSARGGGEALPLVDFAREMLRREDRRRGHHHELDVGDGHVRSLRLLLGVLQHDDILGDPVGMGVVPMHVGAEGDHVDGMKAPAVGVEEGDDLEGRHLRVEGVGVLEVVVPDLVDDFPQELGGPALGRLETGVVIEAGFVGRLRANADDRGGGVVDSPVVEREADGAFERVAAVVGGVTHGIGDDGREGMDAPQKIVGDLHEYGEERLTDRQEVVVRGLSLEGGKSIASLFEEEGDRAGSHAAGNGWLLL